MRLVARHGPVKSSLEAGEARPLTRELGARVGSLLERRTLRIDDLRVEPGRSSIPTSPRRSGGRASRPPSGCRCCARAWRSGRSPRSATEVRPFTDQQITLLETFADQAVIAIENVRLFQELQARTQDLSQSLEETGALSEVIRAVELLAGPARGARHGGPARHRPVRRGRVRDLRAQSGAQGVRRGGEPGAQPGVRERGAEPVGRRRPRHDQSGHRGGSAGADRGHRGGARLSLPRALPSGGPALRAHGADGGRRRRAGHRGRPSPAR